MKVLSQERLAEIVRVRRKEKGLTQEKLSQETEINRSMIVRLEKSDYIPSIIQLERLAKVLEFDPTSLFTERKPPFSTAFRRGDYSKDEQEGIDHLFDMMLAVRQQILLRRALSSDKDR
jgi:transcriptional regulator with XRE-family HTH domain